MRRCDVRIRILAIVGTLSALLARPAWAHVGVSSTAGFSAGLFHPLSGPDHWLAMVAVGIWAQSLGGRAIWSVPLGFFLSMLVGSLVGMEQGTAHWAETGILASLVFLGLLLLARLHLPTWFGTLAVALFSFFHGHAHGSELPPGALGWSYVLGFSGTTAFLHLLGLCVGAVLLGVGGRLRGPDLLLRLVGLAVLVSGARGVVG